MALQFSQSDGLKKTYAHYFLFKNDSPTLQKVFDMVLPKDKQKLFEEIFTELNKKHVKAGLNQFAPNIASALNQRLQSTWNSNKYGISYDEYNEMLNYAELLTPFGKDKMEKEIYENKPQIDFIHEAVIQYFPKEGAVSVKADNKIIQEARKNLQTSLEQGYIGERNSYIEPLTNPPDNIGKIEIKKDVFDKLPNVLHLEAVAELHRRAFLTVDKKDALELIANHKQPPNPKEYKSTDTLTTKTLYVKNDNNEYMVSSIQLNEKFEKYVNGGGCWAKEEEPKKKTKGGTKQKSKKVRSK